MTTAAASSVRARTSRRQAVVTALFTAFVLGLLTALPLPSALAAPEPVATTTDPPAVDGVTVTLVSATPEVVRPGDTFTVVAEITNRTAVTLESPVARLSVARVLYTTRSALSAWAERGPSNSIGSVLDSSPLPEPLLPGTSTTVTFSLPASALGLSGGLEGWGPRGMAVSVFDSSRASVPTAVLRSYLLWMPVADAEVTPVDVGVAVPVVGPAYDPLAPSTSAATLEEATTKGGRLDSVLAATEGSPGVTWVVDPALVSSDPGEKVSEPETSQAAAQWTQRLLASASGREVYALPQFDQDVTALAAAGTPLPPRAPLPEQLTGWRTDLQWPASEEPDIATLTASVAAGSPVSIVAPGTLAPDPELTYTPSATAVVPTDAGPVTALVPDAGLSAQLTTPLDASAAAAHQRLLAELAIISRERPAEARQLLVTVPRDWSPEAVVAQAQLRAFDGAPWVRTVAVSALAAAPESAVARPQPGQAPVPQHAVSGSTLSALQGTADSMRAFASIVPDPSVYTAPVDDAVLAATSVAWRSDVEGRRAAIARIVAFLEDKRSKITVQPTSDFLLISSGSAIPLEVFNDLDQPVTVRLSLDPDDNRLSATTSEAVEIAAKSTAKVQIPVTAVGSGDVSVQAVLSTADGTYIASPVTFKVRVRADWENRGTAVVVVALVIMLAAGIYRTIHRGRSSKRSSSEEIALLEHSEALEHEADVRAAAGAGESTDALPTSPPGPGQRGDTSSDAEDRP